MTLENKPRPLWATAPPPISHGSASRVSAHPTSSLQSSQCCGGGKSTSRTARWSIISEQVRRFQRGLSSIHRCQVSKLFTESKQFVEQKKKKQEKQTSAAAVRSSKEIGGKGARDVTVFVTSRCGTAARFPLGTFSPFRRRDLSKQRPNDRWPCRVV